MLDRLPFLIGLRYVRAKRRNHFISFISLTSMLGLMLGVAVLILVLSVMNGFDHELRTRVLGMVPHTRIEAQGGMTDWKALAERLEKRDHVIGAAPFVQQQGMFSAAGRTQGALVNGIQPDYERKVSIIDEHMTRGSLDDLKPGEWNVVLGDLLARNLGVGVGDRVTLLVPEASITPGGVFPRLKRFTVSGIFKVGADLDANLAYANIHDMQVMRANLFFREALDDGRQRRAMNVPLPLFIPSPEGRLPPHNVPADAPPQTRSRAKRADTKLEDTPFLPSLRAYRYR